MQLESFILVDACAFIEQLFHQGRNEEYDEKIMTLISRGHKAAITPVIIMEIIQEIFKFVREQNHIESCTLVEQGKKLLSKEYHRQFHHFKEIAERYDCRLLHPQGEKFADILQECCSLRLGPKSDQDQLNLAIAISNNCKFFLTGDEAIKKEERRISQISQNNLKIEYVSK